jgi:molybdopterin/thiamine biosynthesis adenylyltransferase
MHASREHEYILIDDDTVEHNNVFNGTSAYYEHHIGKPKATTLAEMVYLKSGANAVGLQTTVKRTEDLIKHKPDIIVDCFDNLSARKMTVYSHDIQPNLHIGVGIGFGSVEWDTDYWQDIDTELENNKTERNENPICTNELGRNIIIVTASIAVNQLNKFLRDGIRESVIIKENPMELYK